MTVTKRVTAGPFTLELPPNGVAVLYEADEGGTDHCRPGGVGYLDALVQFAGEVIRLQAMIGKMQADRNDQDMALRDAIRETAGTADQLAFWKYQAIFWRAYAYDARLMSSAPVPENEETWRTAARDLEAARVAENRDRYSRDG